MPVSARLGSLTDVSATRSSIAPAIRIAAVAFAVAITAAAAQVAIRLPFTPVPFVLTPLAVLLSGAALGSRLGFVAMIAYLAAGIAGVPVFAPSVDLPPGALRLIGPTGGYLLAYPIAAFVTGYLAERGWDRHYLTSAAAMLFGLAVIFIGGVSGLALFFTHSLSSALTQGLKWFILLDVLKVLAAALILPSAWRLLK
jgi:biotin transport system substrate-specific component